MARVYLVAELLNSFTRLYIYPLPLPPSGYITVTDETSSSMDLRDITTFGVLVSETVVSINEKTRRMEVQEQTDEEEDVQQQENHQMTTMKKTATKMNV